MEVFKKVIQIIIIILITVSCSIKYVPIPTKDIIITEDFAVYKAKDYTFAVENRHWIKDPQELTDYFTTFFVTIKNRTSEAMEIKPSEIGLLDENGNQFDIVSIDYIERMLLPKQMEYLMIANLEDDLFDDDTKKDSVFDELLDNQKEHLEMWRNAKRNLMTYSFHFGPIQAGAQKSGFIYFPKLEAGNRQCKISYRNKHIPFVRSDYKEKMVPNQKRVKD